MKKSSVRLQKVAKSKIERIGVEVRGERLSRWIMEHNVIRPSPEAHGGLENVLSCNIAALNSNESTWTAPRRSAWIAV